jgi:hypothetical protein
MVDQQTARRNILTTIRLIIGLADFVTDIIYYVNVNFKDPTTFAIALAFKIWFCAIIFSYTIIRIARARYKDELMRGGFLFLAIIFLPFIVSLILIYGVIYFNWANNGHDEKKDNIKSGNRLMLGVGMVVESFPQLVIQGVNNTATQNWYGIGVASFVLSLISFFSDVIRCLYECISQQKSRRNMDCAVKIAIFLLNLILNIVYVAVMPMCNTSSLTSLIVFIVLPSFVMTLIYSGKLLWRTPKKWWSIPIFFVSPIAHLCMFAYDFVNEHKSTRGSRVLMLCFEMLLVTFPQLVIQGANNSCVADWGALPVISFSAIIVHVASQLVMILLEAEITNIESISPVHVN